MWALPLALTLASSSTYSGIQQLWQTDNSNAAGSGTFGDVVVGDGVTAGFRSSNDFNTAAAATVTVATAATTQKGVVVALDGVGTPRNHRCRSCWWQDPNRDCFRTVAKAGATTDGTLTVNGTADTLTETISLSSNATVVLGAAAKLATVDFSGSTGNITSNLTTLAALTTIKGGAGNDVLTVNVEQGKSVAIDLGAGNDKIVFNDLSTAATTAKTSTITLGAGKDIVTFAVQDASKGRFGNVVDASKTAVVDSLVIVSDFKTSEDVLNLAGKGVALTSEQLTTAAAKADLSAAAAYALTTVGAGKARCCR